MPVAALSVKGDSSTEPSWRPCSAIAPCKELCGVVETQVEPCGENHVELCGAGRGGFRAVWAHAHAQTTFMVR